MDGSLSASDCLIARAARELTGHKRRRFVAEVTLALCEGNARRSEERFGWSRVTAQKGMREQASGIRCLENFAARRRPAWEERQPQLAADIRAIVEPKTQADPELKSTRRYTNLSAREVRQALLATGYDAEDLPAEVLEISMDTKAKVALGDYSRGGKNPDRCRRGSDPGLGP
jgi:hypothetical protein